MSSFNTPEDMDDLRAGLRGSVVMHDLIAQVQRQIAAQIEDLCRRAREKDMNVAVSPMQSDLALSGLPRHVYSIKYDAMLLKPGEPAPAGWTLYEVAK